MKRLLIVTIFLTNILFANSTYTEQNSGKIDMHGGKTDSLTTTGFKNIDIKKPIAPIAPKMLIEDEKKKEEKKEEKKEDKK
ncbi:MAG: hypothetical protein PHV52_08200 [Aliarcobacter sp.]|jgi:hypothetical protein|nr:hypothetical protein [Aliarcobacter sp.]